ITTIPKGLRAIALPLSESMRHSRFLSSGDYIDVLQRLGARESESRTFTVLQRIQVLELSENSVLLAVTPEQAQILVQVSGANPPVFVVRHRDELEQLTLPPITLDELLRQGSPLSKEPNSGSARKAGRSLRESMHSP